MELHRKSSLNPINPKVEESIMDKISNSIGVNIMKVMFAIRS